MSRSTTFFSAASSSIPARCSAIQIRPLHRAFKPEQASIISISDTIPARSLEIIRSKAFRARSDVSSNRSFAVSDSCEQLREICGLGHTRSNYALNKLAKKSSEVFCLGIGVFLSNDLIPLAITLNSNGSRAVEPCGWRKPIPRFLIHQSSGKQRRWPVLVKEPEMGFSSLADPASKISTA
jgi:hypothetical protein